MKSVLQKKFRKVFRFISDCILSCIIILAIFKLLGFLGALFMIFFNITVMEAVQLLTGIFFILLGLYTFLVVRPIYKDSLIIKVLCCLGFISELRIGLSLISNIVLHYPVVS